MTQKQRKKQQLKSNPQAFIYHISEMRQRLLWCTAFFLLASGLGYVIHPTLIKILLQPLHQTLYYTSPAGGLTLIMQLSLLFGCILTLPVIIYNTYKFVEPAFLKTYKHTILLISISSLFLTSLGICFAYFITLPTALFFLNGFNSEHVHPLITTSEYISFVSYYVLGFVILFHLPLILVLINQLIPLKSGTLIKISRYIIVLSFIFAAIVTPTPDPVNQTMLAIPIIALYYLSVGLIWFINYKKKGPILDKPRST